MKNELATEVIRVTKTQYEFLDSLVPKNQRGMYKGLQRLIDYWKSQPDIEQPEIPSNPASERTDVRSKW